MLAIFPDISYIHTYIYISQGSKCKNKVSHRLEKPVFTKEIMLQMK